MDDWIIDGISNGSHIRDHLLKTGHKVEVEFSNSGHVTIVPYMPHPAFAYNKFVNVILGFGGETAIHSKAQETA
ncbi:unnamed protein product [Caenorhabditis nigoni]